MVQGYQVRLVPRPVSGVGSGLKQSSLSAGFC